MNMLPLSHGPTINKVWRWDSNIGLPDAEAHTRSSQLTLTLASGATSTNLGGFMDLGSPALYSGDCRRIEGRWDSGGDVGRMA